MVLMGTCVLCTLSRAHGVWPVRWGCKWSWGMCVQRLNRMPEEPARLPPAKRWEEEIGSTKPDWGAEC